MKSNKNVYFFILPAVIFILIYIIVAAKPLPNEYQFHPVWKINITKQLSDFKQDNKAFYFKTKDALGYFTEDGEIVLHKSFSSKASISDSFYSIYDENANSSVIYTPDGEQKGVIQAEGFPYIKNDLIYLFYPNGSSFAKYTSTGTFLWDLKSSIPITAFSAKNNFTAAGFADGTIKLLNNEDGKCVMEFLPGGSDYPVIMGLDISQDGEYIAAITGHNKQRFIIAHKEENQPKIIFHKFLEKETTLQSLVHFCNDNQRVFYNYNNLIEIYDYKNNELTTIPINTRILSIKESDNLVFLLGKSGKKYTVYIVEKTNTLEGSFTFEADTAFIQPSEKVLYIGKNDSISKITLNRE